MSEIKRTDLENAVVNVLLHDPAHSTAFKSKDQIQKELIRIGKMQEWAECLFDTQGRRYYLKWLAVFAAEHIKRLDEIESNERRDAILPNLPKPPM